MGLAMTEDASGHVSPVWIGFVFGFLVEDAFLGLLGNDGRCSAEDTTKSVFLLHEMVNSLILCSGGLGHGNIHSVRAATGLLFTRHNLRRDCGLSDSHTYVGI
jgi:hypothetical protein